MGGGPRGFLGGGGELDEEAKKNQNIMNIIREGQISLLVRVESNHCPLVSAAAPLVQCCLSLSFASPSSLTWRQTTWS